MHTTNTSARISLRTPRVVSQPPCPVVRSLVHFALVGFQISWVVNILSRSVPSSGQYFSSVSFNICKHGLTNISVCRCIGSIIICASQNIGMLVAGRFINGFSVGICSAQVPVYITEIARADIRGRLVGCQQWAITWGIMIMFYISFGCSYLTGTASFRIPWGLQMVPAIILFFGLFFLPESPRWLARQDRWEESENVIALMHGGGDHTNPYVVQEIQDIRALVEFERSNADATFLELFKPKMIMRTHIGLFTQIWSQLTGMNVMMYYIVSFFHTNACIPPNLLTLDSFRLTSSPWLVSPVTPFSSPRLSSMLSTSP